MKKCTKCGEFKVESLFYKKKNGKNINSCIECIKKISKEYRLRNPNCYKESNKKFRLRNPSYSKEYNKEYRLRNPNYAKEYSKEYRLRNPNYHKEHRINLYKIINPYRDKPCELCKKSFPIYCMDFHHVDPKTKITEVSRMIKCLKKYTIEDVINEIKKCIVVCANCHRIIEYEKNKVNILNFT